MPRKRVSKEKKARKDLIAYEASLKKVQSALYNPMWRANTWRGVAGVREKLLSIDYEVLRNVVMKMPFMNAIINTRIDQILPFCKYTSDEKKPGFRFQKVEIMEIIQIMKLNNWLRSLSRRGLYTMRIGRMIYLIMWGCL